MIEIKTRDELSAFLINTRAENVVERLRRIFGYYRLFCENSAVVPDLSVIYSECEKSKLYTFTLALDDDAIVIISAGRVGRIRLDDETVAAIVEA